MPNAPTGRQPENQISIPAHMAEKLVGAGDGRACILCLALLLQPGRAPADIAREHSWGETELDCAVTVLKSVGFLRDEQPEQEREDIIPVYSTTDISSVIKGDRAFASLVDYTKTRMNKILTSNDLSKLLMMYDYLGLGANVIMLLIGYCASEEERINGKGSKLRMWKIEKEAFIWKRSGIINEREAELYIRKKETENSRVGELMQILQIRGRVPTDTEMKYLRKWAGLRMADEVIYEAYDRTVVNTGGLKWSYMNKILESWDEKKIFSADDLAKQYPPKADRKSESTANTGAERRAPAGGVGNAAERLKRRRNALDGNKQE